MPEPARCTCGQPRGSWECCRDGIDYLNGVYDDEDMNEMIAERERERTALGLGHAIELAPAADDERAHRLAEGAVNEWDFTPPVDDRTAVEDGDA